MTWLDDDVRFPRRRSFRRWRITHRVYGWLYRSGITGSGGSTVMAGRDPHPGVYYTGPGWRSLRYRRPYILGLPRWWWECQLRHQRFRVRGRHWPEQPFAMGVCAACEPCPYCGAHQACADGCWTLTGEGPDPLLPGSGDVVGPL